MHEEFNYVANIIVCAIGSSLEVQMPLFLDEHDFTVNNNYKFTKELPLKAG